MLYIYFNNKVPNEKKFEYAIQGDNKVDVVDFDITGITDLTFDYQHAYIKVQSKDKRYTDKIECIPSDGHIFWSLLAKTTAHKVINVQLSFESDEKRYQTEIVEITLKPYIDADGQIENDYPTVLQDLQEQIDELKEQGGGGGVSDVQIERVWLSYNKGAMPIISQYLFQVNEFDDVVFNDPRHIYLNIKTSIIDGKVESAIKDGLFVIRFDYPIKRKKVMKFDGTNGYDWKAPSKIQVADNGAGHRGFAYSLYQKNHDDYNRIPKADMLLGSLIFVNESDIKTNGNDEKYIHIKMNYIEMIKKFYNFGDTFTINENDYDDAHLIGDIGYDLAGVYFGGLPNTNNLNPTVDSKRNYFNSGWNISSNSPMAKGIKGSIPDKIQGKTFQPCYETFAPIILHSDTPFTDQVIGGLVSRFAVDWRRRYRLLGQYGERYRDYDYYCYSMAKQGNGSRITPAFEHSKNAQRGVINSVKPRCCILKSDYETIHENMWAKKYSQCDQSIVVFCKNGLACQGTNIGYFAFRTIITRKK